MFLYKYKMYFMAYYTEYVYTHITVIVCHTFPRFISSRGN
jgi:hypothetical protein